MKKNIRLVALFITFWFNIGAQPDSVYTSLEIALLHPENVYRLDLEGKELTSLPDEMSKMTHLEMLDISVNNFGEFPPVVFKLTSLKELFYSGAYSYMDQFEREDLLLDGLPEDIASLINLEVLDLSYHTLSTLGAGFQQLRKLKKLDLYHNYMSDANQLQIICTLTNLEVLDIGGNDIKKLPPAFSDLQSLVKLNLDNSWAEGCPVGETLESFPLEICQLQKLETLSLAGQDIKNLPPEIGNLKSVKELYLYSNAFMKLPKEICNLSKLEYLQIGLLCLGSMLELCEKTLNLPKKFCQLTQLRTFDYDGRILSKPQLEMLKKCLPNLH